MVVRPRIMSYPSIHFGVGVACSLGTELPYRPVGAMLVIEEFDEGIGGVSVGSLWEGGGRARGSNDCWRRQSVKSAMVSCARRRRLRYCCP